MKLLFLACLVTVLSLLTPPVLGLEDVRRSEVIYGRKFGTALTLDVLQPAKTNGYGVVWIVSGGFYSDHASINPSYCAELLDRGYTIFAVVHGSQPRFSILEIAEDIHRSIRWIRHHAADYGLRADRLGGRDGGAGFLRRVWAKVRYSREPEGVWSIDFAHSICQQVDRPNLNSTWRSGWTRADLSGGDFPKEM